MSIEGEGITSYDPLETNETKGAIYAPGGQYGMVTNERPSRQGLWLVDGDGNLASDQLTDMYIRCMKSAFGHAMASSLLSSAEMLRMLHGVSTPSGPMVRI